MMTKFKLLTFFMLLLFSAQAQTIELVKDMNPGEEGGIFFSPLRFGDEIVFGNTNSEGSMELWTSDGTAAGTDLFFDSNTGNWDLCGSNPNFKAGELLFFCGKSFSEGLYVAHIGEGTMEIIQAEGISLVNANNFISFNDKVVFTAFSDEYGEEYFITDGSSEGTSLLKDISVGPISSIPEALYAKPNYIQFNNSLIFRANDGIHGEELWILDGTTEEIQLLKDLDDSPESSAKEEEYLVLDNHFFFMADYANLGVDFWMSDGSTEGTIRFRDLMGFSQFEFPQILTVFNEKVIFIAATPEGKFLWETDGTVAGTSKIYSFSEDPPFYFANFLGAADDYLIFTLFNGSDELWRTDGTEDGTFSLGLVPPGAFASSSFPVCTLDGHILFSNHSEFVMPSLWSTDGTVDGTEKIADVTVSYDEYYPLYSTVFFNQKIIDGTVYFGGTTESSGYELWQTDGSADGTFMIEDFVPGPEGLEPSGIISMNDQVLFLGNNPEFGAELHRLVVQPNATKQVQEEDVSLILSPNPTTGQFKIDWTNNSESLRVEILDVQGRMLWSDPSISSGQYLSVNLQAGVYILKLSDEMNDFSRKLVIE